jgi:hypothetical protein
MKTTILFIFCCILVFGSIGLWKLFNKCVVTPINILAIKNEEKRKLQEIFLSHGKAYEEVYTNNPLKYENDPRVPEIIKTYQELLSGKLLDEDMKHTPSKEIMFEGVMIPNDDYLEYLKNQTKALKNQSSPYQNMEREYKRVKKETDENKMLWDFRMKLANMGLPGHLLLEVIPDQGAEERINKYKPSDWKKIIAAIIKYEKEYGNVYISNSIILVTDKDTFLDEEKMETYFTLVQGEHIPAVLVAAYVQDQITVEDLKKAYGLILDLDITPEEALRKIKSQNRTKDKEEALRDKFDRMAV